MPTGLAPLVLINADDFGLSSEVNTGIVLAFESSLVSTCTIMANAPAFEEACELAHGRGLAAHTGLHFVLDEGVPLTEALRRESRFCGNDGHLLRRRPGAYWHLSPTESRAVAGEFRAQVARCRSFGLGLTHIDSHHHIHEEMGVIRVMLPAMREEGLRFMRPMRNLLKARTLLRRTYTLAFNANLRLRCAARTRYFGSTHDFIEFVRQHGTAPIQGSTELMVHPTMSSNGMIVDREANRLLSELINAVRTYRRLDAFARVPKTSGFS